MNKHGIIIIDDPVRDHLGSTRVVYNLSAASGTTVASRILEKDDYLPFGQRRFGPTTGSNRWRFSGKEEMNVSLTELGILDFGARFYDPASARWLSPDPLREKYYGINPYTYCAGDPVNYVDPDGRKPRIFIETHGFGHAFVSTGEGKNTTVYTYGRYGDIDKDKSIVRNTTPSGDGVLVRLTGDKAKAFIQHEMLGNDAVSYELLRGSDEEVSNHFNKLFESSTVIPSVGKYANDGDARVVDKYNLFNNNCVTTTIEGTKGFLPRQIKSENTFVPAILKNKLESASLQNEATIQQVSYESIQKEYL